ncbi:MAG: 2OG-Fe(II) oxygenase [Gammaproteobacteria bacterium]|nr:2OG-Fe(II) oxygenase [Gammaproteobacteria bacterium]MDH5631254.1 2OG-Fe(II) oxygenase [Gammaproteobacteria bacterium]
MSKNIQLNPDIDPQYYSRQLIENGRLQIPNFFQAETAQYLHSLLTTHKKWYMAYNDGNNFYESPIGDFQKMSPQQKQMFMNNIYSRAQNNFQYVFLQYYITQAIELNEDQDHPMHQMHHFVNSSPFLDFMRTLTGVPEIAKSDSYATCYLPGHFLTDHDDNHAKHNRVAAYVFSMTKVWNKNWGGRLAFYDEIGNVTEAFYPTFNTLNIFLIPQSHAVQQVAPFAGGSRTSFLGWLQR